jgi:hypothetical protein
MVTKHFIRGLVIFMAIIILGLVIFSFVNIYDGRVTTGTDVGNKAEVAK